MGMGQGFGRYIQQCIRPAVVSLSVEFQVVGGGKSTVQFAAYPNRYLLAAAVHFQAFGCNGTYVDTLFAEVVGIKPVQAILHNSQPKVVVVGPDPFVAVGSLRPGVPAQKQHHPEPSATSITFSHFLVVCLPEKPLSLVVPF
jgi:hypothetical protein